MTKQDNIFELYDKLNKSGARRDACKFISGLIGVKPSSVKAHWIFHREIPDYVTDNQLDEIIKYLQNAIFLQNEVIKNIEVVR